MAENEKSAEFYSLQILTIITNISGSDNTVMVDLQGLEPRTNRL